LIVIDIDCVFVEIYVGRTLCVPRLFDVVPVPRGIVMVIVAVAVPFPAGAMPPRVDGIDPPELPPEHAASASIRKLAKTTRASDVRNMRRTSEKKATTGVG
jgi:hypothetical protein